MLFHLDPIYTVSQKKAPTLKLSVTVKS